MKLRNIKISNDTLIFMGILTGVLRIPINNNN